MTGKRPSSSADLVDSIIYVLSKYNNMPMDVQKISLLVSFENKGISTSWKTVQKHINKLIKEKKVRTIKLEPTENNGHDIAYMLPI